jgi:hypothetical protein
VNDDELLARLRAADPALTPGAPLPDINCLMEAIVNTGTAPRSAKTAAGIPAHPAKATAGRGRPRLNRLTMAAGLLVLAGGITGGFMANNVNGHSSLASQLTLTTTSGTAGAKCAEPVPDLLRGYPVLFEGTVTSVEGSMVTFRVDYWLNGGGAATVRLDSGAGEPERLTFLDGGRYIVAADKDGVVPQCGANMASAETAGQFRQAYGK